MIRSDPVTGRTEKAFSVSFFFGYICVYARGDRTTICAIRISVKQRWKIEEEYGHSVLFGGRMRKKEKRKQKKNFVLYLFPHVVAV